MLVTVEGASDSAGAATFLCNGRRWQGGPTLPLSPRNQISSAEVGTDGCLYLFEGRHRALMGLNLPIRRIDEGQDRTILVEFPRAKGEGIGLWKDQTGALRAMIVTDNGGQPFARSLVTEIDLPSAGTCNLELEGV